jgi:hypothetical protein
MFADTTQMLPSIGWAGFLDGPQIVEFIAALALAIALGAAIAFHPTTARTIDTREEAEMPKVYIMYAFVGAVVGEIVLAYGMVVGFVIFGLGGLMRFRTDTASTRDTGRLIIVMCSTAIRCASLRCTKFRKGACAMRPKRIARCSRLWAAS